MLRKPDKAAKMISYLEERLIAGVYSPGERLPSLRFLMRKFDLSYGTVQRGIDYLLEKTGRFKKIPCRGLYCISEESASNTNVGEGSITIGIFYSPRQQKQGLYYTALKSISNHARRDRCRLKMIPLDQADAREEFMQEKAQGCSGVILLQEYDAMLDCLRLPVPVVGIMMENSYNGTISTVNLDFWSSAELAVQYFQKQKCRTVSIYGSHEEVYTRRGMAFAMLWKKSGGICKIMRNFPRSYRSDCGYLFTSDSWANNAAVKFRQQHGKELSEEHCILGMDGKQLLTPGFHHFPSIAVNWELIGTAAYYQCIERIRHPDLPAQKIYLNGWFLNPDDEQQPPASP
ncbi:MAG: GntR family transcriptional regulator [Oligosphaeraceae bacterium]|nr:GntR family transcriptional regulator [Oligosphaeraceae bacterium]